jgi:hypothetical protein
MTDLRKNGEGYADPTAYAALSPIVREENELEKRANTLIKTLKYILGLAGFELISRIEIRDIRTGREFK